MEKKIFAWLEILFGHEEALHWSVWATVIAIALIATLSYVVFIRILIPVVNYITEKTENKWDDDLLNDRVLKAFSQLIPAIIVAVLLPGSLNLGAAVYAWTVKLTKIYILWAAIRLIIVFLHGLQNALDKRDLLQRHNLEIVRQTVVLFVALIGIIVGVGILINRDPLAILTGLGASAAVLMLVFRDTILGFVAGMQLTVNKMLGRGDWIVAPKAGANGEVLEVKLTTVKVRNWDNSIVTIPPYTLFTDSFQNFQNMRDSGARRVSRSVLIDQTTIRFLDSEEIEQLRTEGLLVEENDPTELNLSKPAEENNLPMEIKRDERIVNLGLLRRYIEHYLEHYPEVIHSGNGWEDLILMARQLQPTAQGVPLELYFFTSRTSWKPFEHLQAEIFDHLYAVIPKFHLSVYQAPSSNDFSNN
ncbi:MAG: mechanosensitive ion channel [Bacteroides sp.]|nr:mechanosensitive ion channel [Bacteroides sp.]